MNVSVLVLISPSEYSDHLAFLSDHGKQRVANASLVIVLDRDLTTATIVKDRTGDPRPADVLDCR